MASYVDDWIYQIPIVIVLLINSLFLAKIMWVSISTFLFCFVFFFLNYYYSRFIFFFYLLDNVLICFGFKVLITKIRSNNLAETHNYKKATKALLVLIPLLGITFCLDMINPSSTGFLVNIYKFSKVVIISTQVSTF